jgi:NAD(P)H-hydrate repair Nnr-like enzyme with NAD(P)H-hydrate epimerase domain
MGQLFHGISLEKSLEARSNLVEKWGLSETHLIESAAFSMAMVVRVALGLSASDGQIAAVVTDSLSGRVVLSTLRQLANAGATVVLIYLEHPDSHSPEMQAATDALRAIGVDELLWETDEENGEYRELFRNCHNVILGTTVPGDPQHPFIPNITNLLNEIQTPVHCIEYPPGMDPDTGEKTGTPLYASSTLTFGLPYQGFEAGAELVGRIYTCDVSFPLSFYREYIGEGAPLFSEQPVIQALPGKPPEPEAEAETG